MKQTLTDVIPFDYIVDYFNFGGPNNPQRSIDRVRQLLDEDRIVFDTMEGLIIVEEQQ